MYITEKKCSLIPKAVTKNKADKQNTNMHFTVYIGNPKYILAYNHC